MLNFEAVRAVSQIGLSLKLNHHNQLKLAQIGETHCTTEHQKYRLNVIFQINEKITELDKKLTEKNGY